MTIQTGKGETLEEKESKPNSAGGDKNDIVLSNNAVGDIDLDIVRINVCFLMAGKLRLNSPGVLACGTAVLVAVS